MAAPGSAFKVKCPSCEAGVTIRDSSLVGKKVDCPKCKFRFVVEKAPEEGAGDADAKTPKKPVSPSAVTAKAKTGDEPAKPSKNKPLPQRDSDLDDGTKKQMKSGSNRTLYIGGGIGILAIAVLAVAFFAGLFDSADSNPPPPKPGGGAQVVPKKVEDPKKDVAKTTGPAPDPKEVVKEIDLPPLNPIQSDITNMLPGDSVWVMYVNGPEFRKTPMGAVLMEESNDSAKAFKRWMGFAGPNIVRFVCSGNNKGGIFSVLRFQTDINIEDIQAAMELDAKTKPFGKRTVYPIKSNELFKMLSEYLPIKFGAFHLPLPKKELTYALSLVDPKTLVIADEVSLEQYYKDDLKRKFKTTYDERKDGDAPKVDKEVPKKGQPKTPEVEKNDSKPSLTTNPSFLTVDPELKIMINQLEGDRTAVAGIAYKIPSFPTALKQLFTRAAPLGLSLPQAPLVGLVVRKMDQEKLEASAAVECEKSADAQNMAQGLDREVHAWARLLTDILHVQVGVGTSDPKMPIIYPKAMRPDHAAESTFAKRLLDALEPPGHAENAPGAGRTIETFQVTRPLPKTGVDIPGKNNDPNVPLTSYIAVTPSNNYLIVKLNVDWSPVYHQELSPRIRASIDLLKGEAMMMTGRPHWHALSTAINSFEKAGTVLKAVYSRPADAARYGVPYPPEQQVSWMVDLLPALGYDGLSRRIRRDEAWNSEVNLSAGSVCIPEFLSRENPLPAWRAHVPSLKGVDLAATNFVGLSGIGMDAANYPDTPEFKNKLGIFGYNRETKMADIAANDGLANTIFMIQVPPNLQRAWIRGGGSTVQGVPETGSIKPFVCATVDGKKGTYAFMADGSIRFLSESIDDKVFQALTTYKGGEKIDNLDAIAPLVKVESKLTPQAPKVESKKEGSK